MYHRVQTTLGSPRVSFSATEKLRMRLGFEENFVYAKVTEKESQVYIKQRKHKRPPITYMSTRLPNLLLESRSLLVHFDIADYSFVRDTAAQSLRSVPDKGNTDEIVGARFDILH